MTKYLKIAQDPAAHACHCGDGNPDCDHWEACDGCGADYRKHEGHDCIDGVPVQDLRALAKELRDALASCETDRDRLRAELDAAHDGEDALRSEVARLRAQIAALQSVPQGVEVTPAEIDAAWNDFATLNSGMLSDEPEDDLEVFSAGFRSGSARLVPTPPHAAPVAVVETQEFRREDRYVVLKRADLKRHATPAQLRELERTCEMIRAGRMNEWKRLNSYVVVADDWPEYKETWAKIQARVTGIPQPIQPEERRVGPGEVVVGKEEWETLNAFLEDWRAPESRSLHDWNTSLKAKAARINALRTSAQAHNGEGEK